MNLIETLVGIAIFGLLMLVIWIVMDDSPTCEERGGKSEFAYFVPVWHGVPPHQFMSMIPIYECRGAKK